VSSDPTGLLIIRVWTEHGSPEPLRAQLRISSDTSGGFERSLSLTQPEQVSAAIDAWLAEMANGAVDPALGLG